MKHVERSRKTPAEDAGFGWNGRPDVAIVVLIIQLAKTLGVDVVAEGVENEEQAELLASMDWSHAQG